MEAIEQHETPEKKPAKPAKKVKKRKAAARKPRQPAPREQQETAALGDQAGLSPTECPFECTAERCVISGQNFCGHPNKGGGSQPGMQADQEAMKRYNMARKTLAVEAAKKK